MPLRAQIILRRARAVNSAYCPDSRYNPAAWPHAAQVKKVIWRENLRVLITGAGGFAGSHLAEQLLRDSDHRVWGCGLSPEPKLSAERPLPHRRLDLTDAAATTDYMAEIQPDRIYHLAGQPAVHASWVEPWGNYEGNVLAALNVLHAVWRLKLSCRMMVVTSMEVYGEVRPEDMPVTEEHRFRPNSPYSASKAAADLLAQAYHLSHGLDIVRVRPLNHIGPRQSDQFVATAFARQLARIEAGLQSPVMRVGNLSSRRDFTDVRDMTRAYALALEHCEPGRAYNIASGNVRSVQKLLDMLLELSHAHVTVEVDPERVRASGTPALVADCTRFRACTGWQPKIPFGQTLSDLLDYEGDRLKTRTKEQA